MKKLGTKLALTVGVAIASVAAVAGELDNLQGAWVMSGMDCTDTFVKAGNGWNFKDRTSSLNTGLLIEGKKITGAGATCTIARIRQKSDHLVASMGCADAIMFNEVSVSFKIIDSDHFQRFDPEFPESAIDYQRCTQ